MWWQRAARQRWIMGLELDDATACYALTVSCADNTDEPSSELPRPDEALERKQLTAALAAKLRAIHPRERTALLLWCGFPDNDERTFEQIGELAGICRERARQLVQHALRQMRCRSNTRLYEALGWDWAIASSPLDVSAALERERQRQLQQDQNASKSELEQAKLVTGQAFQRFQDGRRLGESYLEWIQRVYKVTVLEQ